MDQLLNVDQDRILVFEDLTDGLPEIPGMSLDDVSHAAIFLSWGLDPDRVGPVRGFFDAIRRQIAILQEGGDPSFVSNGEGALGVMDFLGRPIPQGLSIVKSVWGVTLTVSENVVPASSVRAWLVYYYLMLDWIAQDLNSYPGALLVNFHHVQGSVEGGEGSSVPRIDMNGFRIMEDVNRYANLVIQKFMERNMS